MTLNERLDLLAELGLFLQQHPDDPALDYAMRQAYFENRWFTEENVRRALRSLATAFLDRDRLAAWAARYAIPADEHPSKTVALVMAGNIPLVGFHDWLCVFVAGQRAQVKLSDKDKRLLPALVQKLGEWAPESWEYTEFLGPDDRLHDFDAVIATGSNNSARYFEQYFASKPHIIRRNRNGIAVLTGQENMSDLYALGEDVFAYFGLGCRNVSKLYVPHGYHFETLLEALHEYRDIANHDKYRNNFDYNLTLYILNNEPYQNNGAVILREDTALQSRIASLHYEYYDDLADLDAQLGAKRDEIQCVVTNVQLPGLPVVGFGKTQEPSLEDYADGVDTMQFLVEGLKGQKM